MDFVPLDRQYIMHKLPTRHCSAVARSSILVRAQIEGRAIQVLT